ncbi:MAG: Gfo/Idh/MocA family oxidoreductase [Melioribacteraceae bacterium]|nr:MAG: Gfo/Idh/MocA family oxidoreductase [Melioribacteraceae bacterium]
MTKNFALTGIAGYIAPRHLKAIKETGNNLIAAMDPHDSVGILDQYFPETSFFTEFERFDRHLEKLRREEPENKLDYLSICSPNHLHDAHIRLGLRLGADVICEKPLVLNPWNLDILENLQNEFKQKIYTVLQLRVHPALIELKNKIDADNSDKKKEVVLTYITSRGNWYNFSWKGDVRKSGGVATNIGIHFFDLLMWFFGKPVHSEVHINQDDKMGGFIELPNANVKWFLSIDGNDLPKSAIDAKQRTYRSILIDDNEVEFTQGFTDLHTLIYQNVLNGSGFGIEHARPSIELVHNIRNAKVLVKSEKENLHPNLK